MHTYSFQIFMCNEFKDLVFDLKEGDAAKYYKTGEEVLDSYGLGSVDIGVNMMVLVAMAVFYRVLAWGWLSLTSAASHTRPDGPHPVREPRLQASCVVVSE